MQTDGKKLKDYLDECRFAEFFIEGLGWDVNQEECLPIKAGGRTYILKPICVRGSYVVYTCSCEDEMNFPQLPIRSKIRKEVQGFKSKFLIIFTIPCSSSQLWDSNQTQPLDQPKQPSCGLVPHIVFVYDPGKEPDDVMAFLKRIKFPS